MSADEIHFPKGVDWELIRKDVNNMCQQATRTLSNNDGTGSDAIISASAKIMFALEDIVLRSANRHESEMRLTECKILYSIKKLRGKVYGGKHRFPGAYIKDWQLLMFFAMAYHS